MMVGGLENRRKYAKTFRIYLLCRKRNKGLENIKLSIMYNKIILNKTALGFNWHTRDPFLFCVHHQDNYPAGNAQLGPAASLDGRYLGQDFTLKDGWRMYHGDIIPGFPAHPHRGFETITIVLKGLVDHSDSLGASGRYGNGDVQWMTAGAGIQHSEMFPLLNQTEGNPLELFQIWLNLPQKKKFSKPFYKMFWAEDMPLYTEKDSNGRKIDITVVAGNIKNVCALAPPPDSWAYVPENEVNIWLIKLAPEAHWILPASSLGVNRTVYFYRGNQIYIAGLEIEQYHSVDLLSDQNVDIKNGNTDSYLLLLDAKPILEPVVQYGPFVMNTDKEIQQAFSDYRSTQFGGWPWRRHDNVHEPDMGRFATYADGTEEIR
jgi:redox-sensitive bicupin YhaK (pirin superfamily)